MMSSDNKTTINRINWLGILLIVLGVAAVLTPAFAGSVVVLTIGVILLAAGVVSIMRALKIQGGMEKALSLTLGVITALAGIAVIGHPFFGLAFLTLLLVGYFVTTGIWTIVVAVRHRSARRWQGVLVSGLLSLLLGLLIWLQWPFSGLWAVGVLVGINLLSTGFSFVVLASALNK